MVTLLGHAAGNGGYSQGDTYGRGRPLLLGEIPQSVGGTWKGRARDFNDRALVNWGCSVPWSVEDP